jgi:hypothetical protein
VDIQSDGGKDRDREGFEARAARRAALLAEREAKDRELEELQKADEAERLAAIERHAAACGWTLTRTKGGWLIRTEKPKKRGRPSKTQTPERAR